MCTSNLLSGLVERIGSLLLVCGVVFGSSDVDPGDLGIHYIHAVGHRFREVNERSGHTRVTRQSWGQSVCHCGFVEL